MTFCTGGAQGSHLELKWYGPKVFQGALCPCHLAEMAGAVVSTKQVQSGICCARATLVGWLWARGLELPEVVGQLGYLDLPSILTVKVERKHKPWHLLGPLIWREFQKLP